MFVINVSIFSGVAQFFADVSCLLEQLFGGSNNEEEDLDRCRLCLDAEVRVLGLSDILQDPRHKLGYASADTGQVGFSAADAPADDSRQKVAAVLALYLQGST